MIELVTVSDTYRTIIKKGILTNEIIKEEEQMEFFTNWNILTSHLPHSCYTEILTDEMKCGYRELSKFSKLHKVVGVLYVFEDPVLCFCFDNDGMLFHPLSEIVEMTFHEWSEIWMYDLRVHGAIGYLLLLIDQYKRRRREIGDIK